MVRRFCFLLCGIFSCLNAQSADVPVVPAAADGTQIIAEFDGLKLPAQTVWKIQRSWLANLKEQNPNARVPDTDGPKIRRQIIEKEFELPMMEQYVKEQKLTVSDEEVKKRIEGLRAKFAGDLKKYQQFLSSMAKTEEDFIRYLSAAGAMEKKVAADVTPDEIKTILEKKVNQLKLRRCSHLLFTYKGATNSLQTRTKDEARKKAEEALDKLKKGAELPQLAADMSDCPSKTQGGDLGFLARKSELPEAVSEALYKLERPGDITGIIESEFGFDILKLTAVKATDDPEIRENLRGALVRKRLEQLTAQLIDLNRERIKINEELLKVNPPAEATAPDPAVAPATKP